MIDLAFLCGTTGTFFLIYIINFFLQNNYRFKIKDKEQTNDENKNKDKDKEEDQIKEIKYEDKYLNKFISMDDGYMFQEEDLLLEQQYMKDLLDKFQKEEEEDKNNKKLTKELIKETSYNKMLEQFLKKNKNNYVIENTPLGNVAMNFNVEKGSFEYYSDKNIPYRFLETVARRYVITFQCKPLYICMDKEIQLAEQKMKEKKELIKNANAKSKTKDIFATFKNNKPNQSIQPIQINKFVKKDNKTNSGLITSKFQHLTNPIHNNNTQILKENANRYTHLGKFSNFILLKIPTKQDKNTNYNLSYRDYIKLNKS